MIDIINPCEHVKLTALTICHFSLETDFVIRWGTNKSKLIMWSCRMN